MTQEAKARIKINKLLVESCNTLKSKLISESGKWEKILSTKKPII